MPVHGFDLKLPRPDQRATLDRMPGSSVPVIRQPFTATDPLPFWAYAQFGGNRAFDLGEDPAEDVNRADDSFGTALADALREALREVEAPTDQLQRLGF